MTEENDLEMLEESVNRGISLQREAKHKEAITCFNKAISLDENMNGEADSNLLRLKNNSLMKLGRDE